MRYRRRILTYLILSFKYLMMATYLMQKVGR
jgi:hypothetical protein